MLLATFLWSLVDPAQRYLEQHRRADHGPRRGRLYRGAVVFGPGVPGGSREATTSERELLERQAVERRVDYDAKVSEIRNRWASQLREVADEVLSTGRATSRLGNQMLEAYVVRFWRGDSVLVISCETARGRSETRTRLSRTPHEGTADAVVQYLAHTAANQAES